MGGTDKPERPDDVIEHQGRLWKPKPSATSSAEEFLAARTLFIELHEDATWNPWIVEERAEDLRRAERIMQEWTRAEPGHRPMTKRQVEAQKAGWDREIQAQQGADEERFQRDRERYDPEREHARISLLEHQSRLEYEQGELADFRDATKAPAMDPRSRAEEVARLETSIARLTTDVERLTGVVGDPEDVVDERGRFPRDRRENMLIDYQINRKFKVKELQAGIPHLKTALQTTKDRQERSKLQLELDGASRELDNLLAIPRLSAEDMCADCPEPIASHGWSFSLTAGPPWGGPCAAWPGWAAQVKTAWESFEEAVTSRKSDTSPGRKEQQSPQPAEPEPLAVVPSGLPLSQVVERLRELQERYPEAQVRQGPDDRWELWPSSTI